MRANDPTLAWSNIACSWVCQNDRKKITSERASIVPGDVNKCQHPGPVDRRRLRANESIREQSECASDQSKSEHPAKANQST